ncbi:MAG: sigma-70 family RNA polymerase sigma factor [Pyrinomonadaceae bacterium]
MLNLKFSLKERGEGQGMFFSKSIAFDDEDPSNAASAALSSNAYASIELEFIEKLKAGNAESFDVLITRYSADIYALLFRLTENAEEAGDLTQETFLSALKSVKSFRGDSELKTWLFRIAVNHSRNRFRWWYRRKRDKTVSLDAPAGDGERLLSETLAGTSENPEEAAMQRQREAGLRNVLLNLPDIYREVIILCDIEGQSYDEISRMLDINIGTVKSRIARGREELRRRLKDF